MGVPLIYSREGGGGCWYIWWGRGLSNRSCISVRESEGYVSTGGPERTGRVLWGVEEGCLSLRGSGRSGGCLLLSGELRACVCP